MVSSTRMQIDAARKGKIDFQRIEAAPPHKTKGGLAALRQAAGNKKARDT